MDWLKEKKWMISCVIMSLVIVLLALACMSLFKQNKELNQRSTSNLSAEWYQLYRLSDTIEKNFINQDFQHANKFQLYVNQSSYHFRYLNHTDELSFYLIDFLIFAYDPLFSKLSWDEQTLNKEAAQTLLKAMNDDLLHITKQVNDMNDSDKQKLLDPSTTVYKNINSQVKTMSDKYVKLVDDYFRMNRQ